MKQQHRRQKADEKRDANDWHDAALEEPDGKSSERSNKAEPG